MLICIMLKPETDNKTLPTGLPQWRDRKKYNIHSDIRTLLGKSCKVEKVMKFLKETEMFEKIFKK